MVEAPGPHSQKKDSAQKRDGPMRGPRSFHPRNVIVLLIFILAGGYVYCLSTVGVSQALLDDRLFQWIVGLSFLMFVFIGYRITLRQLREGIIIDRRNFNQFAPRSRWYFRRSDRW